MPSARRLHLIAHLPGADRSALAAKVFSDLKAASLIGEESQTALTGDMKQAVQRTLEANGRPAVEVKTVGDAFEAFTADIDGDGTADFDLDALAQSGLGTYASGSGERFAAVLSQDSSLKTGQTILAGDAEVEVSQDRVSLPLRLSLQADGTLATFDPKAIGDGSRPIAEAQAWVASNGFLVSVAGGNVAVTYPLEVPGLTPAQNQELVERLLEVKAQPGTALAAALTQLKAAKAFATGTQTPKAPDEAVVFRASRLDPSRVSAMSAALTKQYGIRPLMYLGYINGLAEAPLAKAVLVAARPQQGITPAFLYAVAMGEGLGLLFHDSMPGTPIDQLPVDGFSYLGVDTFGSRVKQLKDRLFLPTSFKEGVDYTLRESTNEKNERVVSAAFPNVTAGLVALNAMLADERRNFLNDARQVLGTDAASKLTQEQINYFTYLYFNAGPGFGKHQLQQHGLRDVHAWSGPPPANNRVARYNALQRISTWRLIDGLRVFAN